jgi:hypothetical protein
MNTNQLKDTFMLQADDLPKGALEQDEFLLCSRFEEGEVVVSRCKEITFTQGNDTALSKKYCVGQIVYNCSPNEDPDISIPLGGGRVEHPLAEAALDWAGV